MEQQRAAEDRVRELRVKSLEEALHSLPVTF